MLFDRKRKVKQFNGLLKMGDIINTSKKIFSEDNGNLSSMRLIVFIIIVTVLFNWTYINIISKTLSPLNWADIMLVIGPLITKVYQKGKEKTSEDMTNN